MSSTIFCELLKGTADTVERPRPLADGHYIATLRNHEFGTSSRKQTPFVRFIFVPEEESGDVPAGANDGIDLAKKELRKDLYVTPDALYRLSDLLDAVLGKAPGRPFDERLPETRGVRVMIQVTHRDQIDESTGAIVNTFNDIGTVIAYD
jgi:hypothetical protein